MSSRLGTTLPGCFSARNPPGPTSLAWSAHPSLQTPSYAGELSSATAGKKNLLQVPELEWELWLPDTESSGFSAHFYHLPRKKARSRNEGKLTSEFSLGDLQGVKADPHSLTSLACPWHPHWSRACI